MPDEKTKQLPECTGNHPVRFTVEIEYPDYIAVMIYCSVCGALVTQINKHKDDPSWKRSKFRR